MFHPFKLTVLFSLIVLALAAFAVGSEARSTPVLASTGGDRYARLNALTMFYRAPGAEAEIIDVRTPSNQPFQILGQDETGRWLAVSLPNGKGSVQGWAPAGELEVLGSSAELPVISVEKQPEQAESLPVVTVLLTKVYRGPSVNTGVTNILMPYESVQVLGRSEDSRWLAVLLPEEKDYFTGWIQVGEVIFDYI